MNRGRELACCMAATKFLSCSGELMFFPKMATPPAGYFSSWRAMSSVHSVTPYSVVS